jgi:hypothetical protein
MNNKASPKIVGDFVILYLEEYKKLKKIYENHEKREKFYKEKEISEEDVKWSLEHTN